MFPVIVLLGRSNVGKSTLFNKLTHTKGALVSSQPNFTRDRNYGIFQYKGKQFCIIDTGGDLSGIHRLSSSILYLVGSQVFTAVKESDIILFMVDAMVGLVHLDKVIFKYLSVFHKDIIIVVNKTEKITSVHNDIWSFYSLGVQHVIPISTLYSRGIHKLLRTLHCFVTDKQVIQNKNSCSGIIRENKNLPTFKSGAHLLINDRQSNIVKISVVGRPNVGKSTFINCILGENRVVVCDVPGTTRDSIYIPLVYNNKNYLFIDTAGIRHRSKINSFSEQYSINKSLQSLSISDVVLLLIDATLGIVDQDMSLLDMILRKGRPLLVLVNKWDCLLKNINKYRSEYIKEDFVFRMKFLKNINICFISSLYNKGIDRVFSCIDKVQQSSVESFSTSKLTNIMLMAVASHQPSVIFGKRIKLKYAHLGDFNPITIIIHGNRLRYLSNDYKRYLSNYFMDALNLFGVKIKIKFHDSIKLHNY